ncbi:MAG: dipeptidase [Butyrivibrio sp.]
MRKYIDFHCDTLSVAARSGKDDIYSLPGQMVDIRKLKAANVMAQFFAIFFPEYNDEFVRKFGSNEEYFAMCYRVFQNSMEKHSDLIKQAGNGDDIEHNLQNGIISAFLTFEDGRIIDGVMENLEKYYNMGIRLITLTWNYENCFGYPNSGDAGKMNKGLKPFGIEALSEMNRLGILVDVSHLSDGGFYDVAKYCKKPFIASHSNCRALSPHQRNLTDDMIRVLAEHGGVAGLNFAGDFLNEDISDIHSRVERMVAHAAHMTDIGGEDIPAIGTDFDGIDSVLEISNPIEMDFLWDALKKAGFTERQIDKLAYQNAMRIMGDM